MSWDHKHFLQFLTNKFPINFPAYIFKYICTSIKEGIKGKRNVPYSRPLSEVFYQGNLLPTLQNMGVASNEELGTCTSKILFGVTLGNIKITEKKNVITSKEDIQVFWTTHTAPRGL